MLNFLIPVRASAQCAMVGFFRGDQGNLATVLLTFDAALLHHQVSEIQNTS